MKLYRTILYCALGCSLSLFDGYSSLYAQRDEQAFVKADDLMRRAREMQSARPDSALSLARQALVLYAASNNNTASEMTARQFIATLLTKLDSFAEAEPLLLSAGKYYESNGNTSALKDNYILLAILGERSGKYSVAIDCYNKALALAKSISDAKGLGICYNNLGVIYEVQGDYPRALAIYYESLNYKNQIDDEAGKASAYNNIGNIHKIRGDWDSALEFHHKALAIRKQQGDAAGEATSLNNIGVIYKAKGNLETAAATFNEALKAAPKSWDKRLLGRIYTNIAGLSLFKRNYSEALRYYDKAIAIFTEQSDYQSLASCYNVYAALQYEMSNPRSAIVYLKKSLNIATTSSAKASLKETFGSLATCYAAIGQYDSAFAYQAKFSAIVDSISVASVKDNISKAQLRREADQRGAEVLSLKRVQEESSLALLTAQRNLEKMRVAQAQSEEQNKSLQEQTNNSAALLSAVTAEAEKNRTEAESKRQQLQLLQKDKELADAELQHQQLFIWFGGSITILLSLITGLLLRTNATAKRHSADLEDKNNRIAEKAVLLEQRNNEILRQKVELTELADKISLKNVELQGKNEELHRVNVEHDNLLSIAAHDLKNSLSGIKMLSGILTSMPEQLDAKDIKELGASIKGSSAHLFHVIKGLTDINAIESGAYNVHIEPAPCADIIDAAVQKNVAAAEKKDIRIVVPSVPENLYAISDTNALYTILDNLVSNAITFSPPGKAVIVKAETRKYDNASLVQIRVTDQGPGFTEQDKAKLYSTFAKLSARPTGEEFATGLGLAMSKKLADATGGLLRLEHTSPDEGSTFVVTYPVATEFENIGKIRESIA
ncbi:MAG: tetratricopeptide repeat protein [Bacteroidetes bacterium]|nr:tetratricopeptide repeat protein [Bacteroidota bacterium]